MARALATAFVTVKPNFKGFDREAQNGITSGVTNAEKASQRNTDQRGNDLGTMFGQGFSKGTKQSLTKGLADAFKSALSGVGGKGGSVKVGVDADTTKAQGKLKAFMSTVTAKDKFTIKPDVDDAPAFHSIDQIRARMAQLAKDAATATANVNSKKGMAEIASLQRQLGMLNGKSYDANLGVHGLETVDIKLMALETKLHAINGDTVDVKVKAGLSSSLGGLAANLLGVGGAESMVQKAMLGLNLATGIAEPAIAALTVAVGAASSMFVGLGVSVAGYALIADTQIKGVTAIMSAQSAVATANATAAATSGKAHVAAAQAATAAETKYKVALDQLDPAQRQMAGGLLTVKNEFDKWSQSLSKPVLSPLTKSLSVVKPLLQTMTPFVREAASAIGQLIGKLDAGLKGSGFNAWIQAFLPDVKPLIDGIAKFIGGIVLGIGHIIAIFRPFGVEMATGLGTIGEKFKEWSDTLSQHTGFQSMMSEFKNNWPGVKAGLLDLVVILKNVLSGFAGISTGANSKMLWEIADPLLGIVRALSGNPAMMRTVLYVIAAASAFKQLRGVTGNLAGSIKSVWSAGSGAADLVRGFTGVELAEGTAASGAFSFGGKLSTVFNGMKSIGSTVVTFVGSIATMAGAWIADAAAATAAFVAENAATLGIIAGVAALIGAIVYVVTHWKQVTDAAKDCYEWLKAHPYVMLLVPIVGVIVEIIAHWGMIKNAALAAFNGIKAGVMPIFNGIKSFIMANVTALKIVWNGLKAAWNTSWNAIKSAINVVWNAIKSAVRLNVEAVSTVVKTAWNALKSVTQTAWNAIRVVLQAVWAAIKTVVSVNVAAAKAAITVGWNAIKSATQTVWNAIKSFFNTVWAAIKSAITTQVNAIKSLLNTAWDSIKSTAETAWNAIKSFFTSFWQTLKSTFTTDINALKSLLSTAWNAIKSAAETAWNAIKAFFSSWWSAQKTLTTQAVSWVKNALSSGWNAIKTTAESIWNGIKSFFSNWWSQLKNTVANAVDWIKSHLSSAWSSIRTFAVTAWGGIATAIGGAFTKVKNLVMAPVKWIADHVWNPFAAVLNKISSFVGMGAHIPTLNLSGGGVVGDSGAPTAPLALATGGVLSGYSPGHDSVHAMLSPGEAVIVPEAVRAIGPDRINSINRQYAHGRRSSYSGGGLIPQFGGGGILGDLGGAITNPLGSLEKGLLSLVNSGATAVAKAASKVLEMAASKAPRSSGDWSTVMAKLPIQFLNKFVSWVTAHDQADTGVGGGSGSQVAQYAKTYATGKGHPYVTGGGTPAGWDCSGFSAWVYQHFGYFPGKQGGRFGTSETQFASNLLQPSSIQPGALVFFDDGVYANPGHVGVALNSKSYVGADSPDVGTIASPIHASVGARIPKGGFQTGGPTDLPANGVSIGRYMMQNGFDRFAAAGVAGTAYGESRWNPESVGSGGNGLIGWTPPLGGIVTGNARRDFDKQLPLILRYYENNSAEAVSRGGQSLAAFKKVGNLHQALEDATAFEGPLVPGSDINVAAAEQVYRALAGGGIIPGYAGGTGGAKKGWAWVGEQGKELVNFSGGETVVPHDQSIASNAISTAIGYAAGTLGWGGQNHKTLDRKIKDTEGNIAGLSKTINNLKSALGDKGLSSATRADLNARLKQDEAARAAAQKHLAHLRAELSALTKHGATVATELSRVKNELGADQSLLKNAPKSEKAGLRSEIKRLSNEESYLSHELASIRDAKSGKPWHKPTMAELGQTLLNTIGKHGVLTKQEKHERDVISVDSAIEHTRGVSRATKNKMKQQVKNATKSLNWHLTEGQELSAYRTKIQGEDSKLSTEIAAAKSLGMKGLANRLTKQLDHNHSIIDELGSWIGSGAGAKGQKAKGSAAQNLKKLEAQGKALMTSAMKPGGVLSKEIAADNKLLKQDTLLSKAPGLTAAQQKHYAALAAGESKQVKFLSGEQKAILAYGNSLLSDDGTISNELSAAKSAGLKTEVGYLTKLLASNKAMIARISKWAGVAVGAATAGTSTGTGTNTGTSTSTSTSSSGGGGSGLGSSSASSSTGSSTPALNMQGLISSGMFTAAQLGINAATSTGAMGGLSKNVLMHTQHGALPMSTLMGGAGMNGLQSFDVGGYLRPGLTMAYNGTSHNEKVTTHESDSAVGAEHMKRLDRMISLLERQPNRTAQGVADAMNGVSRGAAFGSRHG